MSHSPMMGRHDPDAATVAHVDEHLAKARDAALAAPADVTVIFAPDHYNGFFYRAMPPFCIATRVRSVGDFGTAAGQISVDENALVWTRDVMAEGVDLTFSVDLKVDHGFVQPLEILFGGLDRRAVLPVFINSVATPLVPMHRIRRLGEAIGGSSRSRV